MKILVIGSEGFIGNNIVNYYVSKGHNVSGIDIKNNASKNNYTYFYALSINYRIENITHSLLPDVCIFAGGSANVQLSIDQPGLDFEANVTSVASILESILRINSRCKFIHISSAAVYGNPKSLPINESAEVNPLSPYGWHKYQAEILCKEFFQTYQIPTCSIRPFSVFGEGQKKLLFWDLFNKLCTTSETIELFGTGDEVRDFIYIKDLVKALDLIVQNGEFKAEVYNVAGGEKTSIRQAVELVKNISGSGKKIVFNKKTRPGDPQFWEADISKLKSLGYNPIYNLESGLQNYYEWLRENA